MSYIETPNLPENKIKKIICNNIYGISIPGIEIIPTKPLGNLPKPEQAHADMQIVHIGDNTFICPPLLQKYYADMLPDADIISGKSNPVSDYPLNVCYNVCIIENAILCKTDVTDEVILKEAKNRGYRIINTRQGYSKCSVCILNEKAVITADRNIYSVLKESGFDVLLISPGNILLPGYDYGFIGGCCGKLSKDMLYFYGDVSRHPDYEKILEFSHKYGVDILFDNSFPLTDIGSIIPL